MTDVSLQQALTESAGPATFVRGIGPHADTSHLRIFADLPDAFTNWQAEQAAWKGGCALSDLSHHMYELHVEGPDALELFSDLGVNDFSGFSPGQAKQFVAANPDGHLIGDGILFCMAEDAYTLVGYAPVNWVRYNLAVGDYDATAERVDHGGAREGPPVHFRYQVQGPEALAVIRDAIDGPLPDVPFFNFREVAIDGTPAYALRHGMMDEPGYEFFGDWARADDVRDALLSAGEDYGIRRVGAKAYPTNVIPNAWIPMPVPAIFGESMAAYREWLPASSFEGAYTVAGSFAPDDVADYYLTPFEAGHGRFVDFDHDFVGREALREEAGEPARRRVTLEWDPEDVTGVFGSLFDDGPTAKFVDLPTPNWAVSMYDAVRQDGAPAGVSIAPRYLSFARRLFSLGVVDADLAEPGTEVTVTWGEPGPSPNPRVEAHEQVDVRATVAPAPYYEDKRKTADYTSA